MHLIKYTKFQVQVFINTRIGILELCSFVQVDSRGCHPCHLSECPLLLITLQNNTHLYNGRLNSSKIIFTYIPCILILSKFFIYSPTDEQVNCLKNHFKIYIRIDIKTVPTCFGADTPSSGSALLVIAKVTVVKIAN